MASTAQDATIWSGDDVDLQITVTDPATDTPKQLQGASVRWVLFDRRAGQIVLTKTTGAGITLTNAAAGIFTVALDAADTDALAGVYTHEAQVTDAGGRKSTVTTGTLTIMRDYA
jgi:hypothetical protein